MTKRTQSSLFDIAGIYANRDTLSNEVFYKNYGVLNDIRENDLNKLEPIGEKGHLYSKAKREARWYQQDLKRMGLLEQVERGIWRLTEEGRKKVKLHQIVAPFAMLAFSTKFGIAIFGDARRVFEKSTEPIHLILSSPPYPLIKERAYGNVNEKEFVDWLCYTLEPVIKNLVDGGSIVLNISNDIHLKGLPAKSLYKERLVLALNDRFGLFKMDEIPWINTSKMPTNPYATKDKIVMRPAWEPILWMCNNPKAVRSDATRILKPHTKKHLAYVRKGGAKKRYENGDGAYVIKEGAFANETSGALPQNVFMRGHRCKETNAYHLTCKELGLPRHAATFPADLPRHFIQFLTEKGELVADPFGGSLTSVSVAEALQRRWISTDITWEYLRGGGERFESVLWNQSFLEMADNF